MNEYKIGGYVIATAGHDLGKYYVIFQIDNEYVYLVDGKIRTLNHTKKKKMKHVKMLEQLDHTLTAKLEDKTIRDEEIKRAIKLLQNEMAYIEDESLLKNKEAKSSCKARRISNVKNGCC